MQKFLVLLLMIPFLAGCEVAYSRQDADRLGRDEYYEKYVDATGAISLQSVVIHPLTGCEYFRNDYNAMEPRLDIYGRQICSPPRKR